jgi:hypothetical protein
MLRRKLLVPFFSLITASMLTLGAGPAFGFAQPGAGNSGNAPGQANSQANCSENIGKQNVNGQTGANTGSANDEKQLDTAITNCDHFWDFAGSNP